MEEQTALDNLALPCIDCNLHQGPNLTGVDPKPNGSRRFFIRDETNGKIGADAS